MAKTKTVEELKTEKTTAKEELDVAKKEFKSFCKEKKIDADSTSAPADEKVAKKLTKLKDMVEKKQKAYDDLKAAIETAKSTKKESAPRELKYTYPADATPDQKKKIRAEARAEAKRKLKAEAKAAAGEKEPKKKDKKEKESEKKEGEKKKKDKKPKETPSEEANDSQADVVDED